MIGYEKLSEKLRKNNINLIIIGIALDIQVQKILSTLCRSTYEGIFIESIETTNLDIAF